MSTNPPQGKSQNPHNRSGQSPATQIVRVATILHNKRLSYIVTWKIKYLSGLWVAYLSSISLCHFLQCLFAIRISIGKDHRWIVLVHDFSTHTTNQHRMYMMTKWQFRGQSSIRLVTNRTIDVALVVRIATTRLECRKSCFHHNFQ